MTLFKKLTAVLLVLLTLVLPIQAAQDSTDELVRQLINYFHHYQGDARLDCELILEQIEAQDPELAATWLNILDFWTALNDDMEFHSDVLPDGLPGDDSLCIVVMGYYLHSDGGMRDELYQRMHVALASAEKYPNAYIMCTGGGTASNGNVTEAGQMAKWLKKKGIDPDRIIVENKALSTIENATYGSPLLYREYPQVKNLAIITSDYHIYRSCLYFHVQSALDAYELGVEPMKVISNATCRVTPKASRDIDRQTEGVGMLTELDVVDMSPKPLTFLESISVSGQTEYAIGGALNLAVTAHYSNGCTRDVTDASEIIGFNPDTPGFQTVSVCYGELIESVDIYLIPPETLPLPAEMEPVTTAPTECQIPAEAVEPAEPDLTVPIIAACLLLLLVILLVIKAKQKKKRRRPRPTIKLN